MADSTDDDVACCLAATRLGDVPAAACTSLRCLAADLHRAHDLDGAKRAVLKHDRYVYALGALVLLALLWALLWPSRPVAARHANARFTALGPLMKSSYGV